MKYPNLQKAIQQRINLKMKVTPEQSAEVQKLCFDCGVYWRGTNSSKIKNTECNYLYIIYQCDCVRYGIGYSVDDCFSKSALGEEFNLNLDDFQSNLPNPDDYPNLKQLIQSQSPIAIDTTTETAENIELFVKLCQLNGVQWFSDDSNLHTDRQYVTLWDDMCSGYTLGYENSISGSLYNNIDCQMYSVKDDELYDNLPSMDSHKNLRQLLRDKKPLCIDTNQDDVQLFLRIAKQEGIKWWQNRLISYKQQYLFILSYVIYDMLWGTNVNNTPIFSLQYDMFYDDMPVSADGHRLDKFMELVETDCGNVEYDNRCFLKGWTKANVRHKNTMLQYFSVEPKMYRIKPKSESILTTKASCKFIIDWDNAPHIKGNSLNSWFDYSGNNNHGISSDICDAYSYATVYGKLLMEKLATGDYNPYSACCASEPVKQYPITKTTINYLKSIADDARAYDINPDCIGDNETVVSDILGIKNDALLTITEELDKIKDVD